MIATIAQIAGYLASVLLAISLIVNNNIRFRWINSGGCLFFIIYGLLIQAWPVVLTNTVLLVINLIYLWRLYRRTEDFDLVEVPADSPLVEKFLHFYKDGIQDYFPDFKPEMLQENLRFVVLRDLVIANIFIARLDAGGEAQVRLNFTIPPYRDFKIGRFLFRKENEFLISRGVKRIVYDKVAKKSHAHFLKVSGFAENNQGFVLNLPVTQ